MLFFGVDINNSRPKATDIKLRPEGALPVCGKRRLLSIV